jgi:hypothetical protein
MNMIIISAADAGYWNCLSGLLHSIEPHIRRERITVGILDVGPTTAQRDRLEKFGALRVEPQWDYPIEHFGSRPASHLRAMTARPHLPRYFPGYEMYIWLDADCWVQDWQVVAILVDSARERQFSIVAELHRSYSDFFTGNVVLSRAIHRWFAKCYGERAASHLIHFPYLNSGVFSALPNAPHWLVWQNHLGKVLKRLPELFIYAEQTALNGAIRLARLPIAVLPAHYNFMCNRALPRLALDGSTFVEPEPPYLRIGILHLAALTHRGQWPIVDLRGNTHHMVLAYPPLDSHSSLVSAD